VEALPLQRNSGLISGPTADPTQPAVTRFDLWGLISRRKWIVFLALLTGLGLGYLYHTQATPIYESTAQISIEPKNPLMLHMVRSEMLAQELGGVMTSHDENIDSASFIQSCFQKRDLFSRSSYRGMTELDIVNRVAEDLEIFTDPEDPNIFELSFRALDSTDSQVVLNQLIDAYKEELENNYTTDRSQTISTFQETQARFAQENARLRAEYQSLKEQHETITIAPNGMTLQTKEMLALSDKLDKLNADISEGRRELDQIQAAEASGQTNVVEAIVWDLERRHMMGQDPRTEVFVASTREKLAQSIATLQLELATQGQYFGANHPMIVAGRTRLEAMKAMYAQGSAAGIDGSFLTPAQKLEFFKISTTRMLNLFEQERAAVQAEYDASKQVAARLESIRGQMQLKEQEIERNDEFLAQTLMIINELGVSEGSLEKGFYFRILANAENGLQVWPNIVVILALGGIAGLAAGLGLAYLIDIADKTFRSPEEITRQLGLPLIGHIPIIATNKKFQLENSLVDPVVCTYHRPKSHSAEAFRAVRTALYFNTQGKQHNVVQITSPTPGDGKSTVAANLAVSIAQSGKRVLLVDGDMRRPALNHMFGIKSAEGFATAMAGRSRWEDHVFVCEEIEGLSVLPCGDKPPNPAELITSPRVKQVIDEMRRQYDFVIIDTPPVLAVTDPCPVAARVDGVILTLRIKKNVKISADRAAEILSSIGANIIGVVVNGIGIQSGYGSQYSYGAYRAGYAHGFGFGYGYGYGYGVGQYFEEDRPTRAPRQSAPRIESRPTDTTEESQVS
jgi:capsular exopolysaccharide synthesis family protein